MSARLSDYEYELPRHLIAKRPLPKREASRLMVLRREDQSIEHRRFCDLPTFIRSGDLLVLNNTRVLPARVYSDDGRIELLLLERLDQITWRCLAKPGKKVRVGARLSLGGEEARVEAVNEEGERVIRLSRETDLYQLGAMPIPPYLQRPSDSEDEVRYQTVFAETPGAVAAPTAGLHFTRELLEKMPHVFVTLHVGPATFRPVQSERIAEHRMHSEKFSITSDAAEKINNAGRVIAVGTTTVRVLESSSNSDGVVRDNVGVTDLFIFPPFEFRATDALITNFHLPRSTLLMLVSAFAGREFLLRAYAEAIQEQYRFYSYGDSMLIL